MGRSRWGAWILVVGIALRVALATVNREANDHHLPVATILADEGRAPRLGEVWESFQPKLYHLAVAVVWRVLGLEQETPRVIAAQLVSCAAGIVTIVVLHRFLALLRFDPRVQSLALAIAVLNPGLVAISAQATNDALVICLGALVVSAAYRFFVASLARDFWRATVAASAALLAKGNAVALPLAVLATFALSLVRPVAGPARALALRRAVVFAAVCFVVALAGGPYAELHARYGSPLSNPVLPGISPPALFTTSEVLRPGVRSVSEALFTFRLADMLRRPMISNGDELRELHRTSLWSQLYGRATFSRFASHPPSWATTQPEIEWLGRALLLLGLVPALLLAVGLLRSLGSLAGLAAGRTSPAPRALGWSFLTLVAWGYVILVAAYALRFRDFAGMKEIFLYPGLLAFAAILGGELQRIVRKGPTRKAWHAVVACTVELVACDILDLVLLIRDLGAELPR
jgi:hypothetical protein